MCHVNSLNQQNKLLLRFHCQQKKGGNHGKLNKEPSFVDQVRIPINFGSQIH